MTITWDSPEQEQEARRIIELLSELPEGVGIAITSTGDAWTIDCVSYDLPPGFHDFETDGVALSEAYDLGTAAAAALRPLRRLADAKAASAPTSPA